MKEASIFLALLFITSCVDGAYLYFGDGYFGSVANLYLLDTSTNRISIVGTIQDARGNKYTTNAMHYHNGTGLIYAVPTGRSENATLARSIIAIDPATAQGSISYSNKSLRDL
jgi:hypothetical protein